LKTLPQIARELTTPIATLRYRLRPYEDFIVSVTTSKGKEYSSESEGIIREINQLVTQDKSTESILGILSTKYARDIEVIAESTMAETSQQQVFIEQISRFNDNMEKLIDKMDRQQAMQSQLDDMKIVINEISRVQKNKKWWKVW